MLLWFQSCREIDSCCSRTQCPKASLVPTGPIILKKKILPVFGHLVCATLGMCMNDPNKTRKKTNKKLKKKREKYMNI